MENLTEAIKEAIGNEEIKRNAQALGDRLRKENGIQNAADIIESLYKNKNGHNIKLKPTLNN